MTEDLLYKEIELEIYRLKIRIEYFEELKGCPNKLRKFLNSFDYKFDTCPWCEERFFKIKINNFYCNKSECQMYQAKFNQIIGMYKRKKLPINEDIKTILRVYTKVQDQIKWKRGKTLN